MLNKVSEKNGLNVLIEKVSTDSAEGIKNIAFDFRKQFDKLFMVLAADIDGKPQITVMVSDSLVEEKGLNAGQLVRELAKEIKGGGGGQAFYATAGGKDLGGLDAVVAKAGELV